jgi:hypothetical protein
VVEKEKGKIYPRWVWCGTNIAGTGKKRKERKGKENEDVGKYRHEMAGYAEAHEAKSALPSRKTKDKGANLYDYLVFRNQS